MLVEREEWVGGERFAYEEWKTTRKKGNMLQAASRTDSTF